MKGLKSGPRVYFVTDKWHLSGVEALELRYNNHGLLDNWGDPRRDGPDRRRFFGALGGSAFETRAEAIAAVQKKADAKLRAIKKRHAKQVEFLERVIVGGIDAVFPPKETP